MQRGINNVNNKARINKIAKEQTTEIFTSLYHLINHKLLKKRYDELDESKIAVLHQSFKRYIFNRNC